MIRIESAISQLTSYENAEKAKPFFAHKLRNDDGLMVVDWSDTFRNLADSGWMEAFSQADLAMGFLYALADALTDMAEYAASRSPRRSVVLSGTAFIAPMLTKLTRRALEHKGFSVYTHEKTSPDESSVCIGQAVFGGMS